ncbi:universal stress protein [Paractinoplanes brasiliensis]|uniref:Nucleotide-binding universal stress UspA family protein n=1 Tax=Paractinoplanes brasiliensis TaxID=52695 RepID=A0A4R6JL25_9ACTN|nr:universal stress protein [Actinoplanes brasiliensis]TDO36467.1 nucleotide-binding universal stress UspA family protein [Actinoplanes brasiliensis]GID32520.1 universal stress protein [Actinoplanes brasiliensis]
MVEPTGIRVIVGYDGSPASTTAIEAGARLFPGAQAWITHLWTPPFASEEMRRRLWRGTAHVNEFVAAVEREGRFEADRVAGVGTTLARAAGWEAEPLVERSFGGEGLQFTQLAEKLRPDLVLLGSRGLGGAKAVLGSVSDMVVHYSPAPVLVLPHPLLIDEYEALADGPVVIGWDDSDGARSALAAVERLFPKREKVLVAVGDSADSEDRDVVRLPAGRGASARAVAEVLAGDARERRAAVVAVGSRGRSMIREILLGSVAMATLHRAHRPVLVVPGNRSGDA